MTCPGPAEYGRPLCKRFKPSGRTVTGGFFVPKLRRAPEPPNGPDARQGMKKKLKTDCAAFLKPSRWKGLRKGRGRGPASPFWITMGSSVPLPATGGEGDSGQRLRQALKVLRPLPHSALPLPATGGERDLGQRARQALNVLRCVTLSCCGTGGSRCDRGCRCHRARRWWGWCRW